MSQPTPTKNVPYTKHYVDGMIENPIEKYAPYVIGLPNRKDRRIAKQKKRFFGNGKNTPLVVGQKFKYFKFRQLIISKEGKKKYIEHYSLQ